MRLYPPQTNISQLTSIRRERIFPAPGEIFVQEGERVEPVHILGIALVPGGTQVVNVSKALGVRPRAVRRFLKVKPGQKVSKDQELAARGTLTKVTCRSPVNGEIIGSGGGQLLIEAEPKQIEVPAGYYGTIARLIGNRGVSLQISGALIQGAWGNGREGFGILRSMVSARDENLAEESFDTSCRGMILVGGASLSREALKQAIELQVRGIIVGGILPEIAKETRKAPFPILATEGIGSIPMSAQIFQLISTHDGREAIVDGRFRSRWKTHRPEIIIPLPADPGTDRPEVKETPLQINEKVQAVRAPHNGLIGTVLDLPKATVRTEIGLQVHAAKIQPEDGEPLLIPVANLQVPL